MWKEHFKKLLGKFPRVADKPITKVINNQLNIEQGKFTREELDVILTKIKNRKAASLDEIPTEVWKTRKFDDILLRYSNAIYNQNKIDRWTKNCILSFPKKGNLWMPKNYRALTLASKVANIYNALLLKRSVLEIENVDRKNQNGFPRNRSTSQILIIRMEFEQNNWGHTLICGFFLKLLTLYTEGR